MRSVLVFYGNTRIIFIKPIMMGYVNIVRLVLFSVESNSCSIRILHEVSMVLSIIEILYCNTIIDNIDSNPPVIMCL